MKATALIFLCFKKALISISFFRSFFLAFFFLLNSVALEYFPYPVNSRAFPVDGKSAKTLFILESIIILSTNDHLYNRSVVKTSQM